MNIMLAYDDSRNARFALERTLDMFGALKPMVILIGVVEESLDTSDVSEENYLAAREQFTAAVRAAAERVGQRGLDAEVVIGEGDARKVILKAVQRMHPDLLVIARRSDEPDGHLAHSIDALVEEFNFMTFGSVSSFLARRAPCPVLIQACPAVL
jgi:nucleotide-binding universal stress UspA family protein